MATLRVAFSRNPRLEPLLDGTIQPDGLQLAWSLGHPGMMFLGHLKDNAFDVFEFSISEYLITRQKPALAHLRWKALPLFLLKAFLALKMHTAEGSGIRDFSDLRGRRVGLPDFQMTAGIWLRIMLKHLYGIRPHDIEWVNGRPPSTRHGALIGSDQVFAPGISVVNLQEGESMVEMLASGKIDAAFGDNQTVPIQTTGNVRPVLSPPQATELIDSFARATGGVSPVNHTVVIQERLLQEDQDPSLARRVYEAFEASKQAAYQRARAQAEAYLIFPEQAFQRQAGIYGDDPYVSGLEANRRMLGLVVEQLLEEGLVQQAPDLDALFLDPTAVAVGGGR